jgi:glucosylglycerate phosphorylase
MRQRQLDALRGHLGRLYPKRQVEPSLNSLLELLDRFRRENPTLSSSRTLFDETDVWVIAYADHVTQPKQYPIETLERFLSRHFGETLGGIHLLPHYPSTSDGGFAVIDYFQVDPQLGDWESVQRLGKNFRLMLDAVVNHTSASSPWFHGWLQGDPEFADFYIVPADDDDLKQVIRPRTTPLLTPFRAHDGVRNVWTTFGPDQVDLNYANPEVLLRVTEVLLTYVAKGASALRLDAIAFLWKRPGTACIHLPETHEVIRFWRTVLDAVAPGTLIVTETNVPHEENLSYFGHGMDEAHLVYQFPLPPLVLHAFRRSDASTLQRWLRTLEAPSRSTTFLNFLSSHDGIGLRPVEELLPAQDIAELSDAIAAEGGSVSYREKPGEGTAAYELNVTYFDALSPPTSSEPLTDQVARFIAAQSLLLALAGVPAIYLHSLLGSRNWKVGIEATGQPRAINREKLALDEVESALHDPTSLRAAVCGRLGARIAARRSEPAFHPSGEQRVLPTPPELLAFERHAIDRSNTVLCVHNLTGKHQRLRVSRGDGLSVSGSLVELCTEEALVATTEGLDVGVEPYGVLWLRRRDSEPG